MWLIDIRTMQMKNLDYIRLAFTFDQINSILLTKFSFVHFYFDEVGQRKRFKVHIYLFQEFDR